MWIRDDAKQRADRLSAYTGHRDVMSQAGRCNDVATDSADLADRGKSEFVVPEEPTQLSEACASIALSRKALYARSTTWPDSRVDLGG